MSCPPAQRFGTPSPHRTLCGSGLTWLLALLALGASLAVVYEVGRWRGYRSALTLVARREATLTHCMNTLEQAEKAFETCHGFAAYLKKLPKQSTSKAMAKKNGSRVCHNCGGEP